MSNPLQQGYDSLDDTQIRSSISFALPYNDDESRLKLQSQNYSEPSFDAPGVLEDTVFCGSSSFIGWQPVFTDSLWRIAIPKESQWNPKLHGQIRQMPLSYVGSDCSVACGEQLSATISPVFEYADTYQNLLQFDTSIASRHAFDCRVSDSNGVDSHNLPNVGDTCPRYPYSSPRFSVEEYKTGPTTTEDIYGETERFYLLEKPLEYTGDLCLKRNVAQTIGKQYNMDITGSQAGFDDGESFSLNAQKQSDQFQELHAFHTPTNPKTNKILRHHAERKQERWILPFHQQNNYPDPLEGESAFPRSARLFKPQGSISAPKHFLNQTELSSTNKSLIHNKPTSEEKLPQHKIPAQYKFPAEGRLRNPKRHPRLGRTGPLNPATSREAARMRITGACVRCRAMRISCTADKICENCKNGPLQKGPCIRFDAKVHTNFFFPTINNSSYNKSYLESYIIKNAVPGSAANKFEVQISSGPTYNPITLSVYEYRPLNEDSLATSYVKTGSDGTLTSELVLQYTPPFMLDPISIEALEAKCMEHVWSIGQGPRCLGEVYYKDTSTIAWEAFIAITDYQKSAKDDVIQSAIVLYAMYFFMVQRLLFTNNSANIAIEKLVQPTKLPYAGTSPSNIINIQIKQVMYDLVYQKTANLLGQLAAKLQARGPAIKDLWFTAFSSICILCMCAELVQCSADLFTVQTMIEDADFKLSRAKNLEELREIPIIYLTEFFHIVFRSFKPIGRKKHEGGYNPIRDGLNSENSVGLDLSKIEFVKNVHKILSKHERDMRERVHDPPLGPDDDLSNLLARHLDFRKQNSGKLVTRFFLSFFKSVES